MNVQAETIVDVAETAIARAEIAYGRQIAQGHHVTIKQRNRSYAMAVIEAINVHMTTMENHGADGDELLCALADALEVPVVAE
jgi:hypothetical protein